MYGQALFTKVQKFLIISFLQYKFYFFLNSKNLLWLISSFMKSIPPQYSFTYEPDKSMHHYISSLGNGEIS